MQRFRLNVHGLRMLWAGGLLISQSLWSSVIYCPCPLNLTLCMCACPDMPQQQHDPVQWPFFRPSARTAGFTELELQFGNLDSSLWGTYWHKLCQWNSMWPAKRDRPWMLRMRMRECSVVHAGQFNKLRILSSLPQPVYLRKENAIQGSWEQKQQLICGLMEASSSPLSFSSFTVHLKMLSMTYSSL